MNEIRNRIITISGEPVSGKSTVVKNIKSKYEELGFNVHIISVGKLFRNLIKEEYEKMYPDRTNWNIADIQTDEAFIKKRNQIDLMVDGEITKKGKAINSIDRPNDVYIIDSRLAWKNIPESYAVRLVVNENIAGKRVFEDKTRGTEDKYNTEAEAIEKTKKRKLAEIERYKQRYGIDLTDSNNYNLIIDTTYSNTDELANIIINGEETYRNGTYYPKNWRSPALFLPSQRIGETLSCSPIGFRIEDIVQSINEDGFDPLQGEINTIEQDNINVLKDGHHRSIAALASGKTLIPYNIVHKDDDFSKKYLESEVKISNIYDWEDIIRYYSKQGNIKCLEDFNIGKVINMNKVQDILNDNDR